MNFLRPLATSLVPTVKSHTVPIPQSDHFKIIQCRHSTIEKLRDKIFKGLDTLQETQKNNIYGAVYHLSQPEQESPQWGEEHVKEDLHRLYYAFYLSGLLPFQPAQISIYKLKDSSYTEAPRVTWLNRNKLIAAGEISYINGINTTFDTACNDAQRLMEKIADSHAVTVVYSGKYPSDSEEFLSAAHAQEGTRLFPAELLLRQWTRFFTIHHDKKYLQICFSAGAAHTAAALDALPDEFRQRIIVIAIAPVMFIQKRDNCEVHHFIKEEDSFLKYAQGNRSKAEVTTLKKGDNDPHNPHCQNYINAIKPIVQQYLHTTS